MASWKAPRDSYWRSLSSLQSVDIGLLTGNGKKLSCSQAQVGHATGLAVASFLFISCGPSYVYRLYKLFWYMVTRGMYLILPPISFQPANFLLGICWSPYFIQKLNHWNHRVNSFCRILSNLTVCANFKLWMKSGMKVRSQAVFLDLKALGNDHPIQNSQLFLL